MRTCGSSCLDFGLVVNDHLYVKNTDGGYTSEAALVIKQRGEQTKFEGHLLYVGDLYLRSCLDNCFGLLMNGHLYFRETDRRKAPVKNPLLFSGWGSKKNLRDTCLISVTCI